MSGDMVSIEVAVEYCGAWGYESRFKDLEKEILNAFPSANVTGKVGRSQSFEVVLNGNLIFSKLECSGFPYAVDVIAEIKKLEAGEKAGKIENSQPPVSCQIL